MDRNETRLHFLCFETRSTNCGSKIEGPNGYLVGRDYDAPPSLGTSTPGCYPLDPVCHGYCADGQVASELKFRMARL